MHNVIAALLAIYLSVITIRIRRNSRARERRGVHFPY
jgi:hypothetical protein